MATIAAGYDFTINEVPTFDKMMLAAGGLTVSGLGLDDLPATLIAMVTGLESGTTGASLPAEGWMWQTPSGELWVETRWFLDDTPNVGSGVVEQRLACPLFRPQGGWCSVRWPRNVNGSEVGNNITTSFRYDNDERYHIWGESNTNGAQDGGRSIGISYDTSASGDRGVVVGRGPCAIRDLGFSAEGNQADSRAYRSSVSTWESRNYTQADSGRGAGYALACAMGRIPYRGSTAIGSMGGWWYFSGVVYGS